LWKVCHVIVDAARRQKVASFAQGTTKNLRAAIENEVGGLETLRSIVEKHLGRPISTTFGEK
jgi:hypothetical protein